MTSHAPTTTNTGRTSDGLSVNHRPIRLTTETKAAFKTTEFWLYIAASVSVMIAGLLVKATDGRGVFFRMDRAFLYVVVLRVVSFFGRGRARAGSHAPYAADRDRR